MCGLYTMDTGTTLQAMEHAGHRPRAALPATRCPRCPGSCPRCPTPEAELTRRFRDGDPVALRAAYDRHGRVVFALAL
jgi:hypothetical protein